MLIRNLALDKGECRKPCHEGQNAIKYPIFVSIYYLSDRIFLGAHMTYLKERERERERGIRFLPNESSLLNVMAFLPVSRIRDLTFLEPLHPLSENLLDDTYIHIRTSLTYELKGGLPHARNVYI